MVAPTRRAMCAGLLAGAAQVPAGDGRAGGIDLVDARDHDAFWLWAGVHPQPVLVGARRLYLLHGEVRPGAPPRLVAQRPATPHIAAADVWLVVRAGTLDWPPAVHVALLEAMARWRAAGNRLVGLQVDFDAHTRHLEDYARFLADLRGRLPAGCELGITGLLDWSANGDPAGLAALAGTVDEIVVQIYQGRRVIPGYAAYLARLDRLKVPFRVGLLQGGEWRQPPGLSKNPWFRGYVVFLRNA